MAVEQQHPVEIGGHSGQIVMHRHHAAALVAQGVQHGDDGGFGGGIDPGKGLVQ